MAQHKVAEDLYLGRVEINDPGNAGTIYVDRSPGIVQIVSAGTETRTLARPTRVGAIVTVSMKTHVGDVTVTVTGNYNLNGDSTFVLSAVGQFFTFVSLYDGTNYFWMLLTDYTESNLSATELGYLDGVVAGTGAASKAVVLDGSGNISFPGTIVRTGYAYKLGAGAKAGTTAGWTVNAGNNLGTIATVAASQTSSTLVVPVINVHVGDTITGFRVVASINSAGNGVTIDADLRKLVVAAGATATDSSIGTMTQISVSAATAANQTKTGLTEVVVAGTRYYLLLTATTGASTTIELDDIELTVTTS